MGLYCQELIKSVGIIWVSLFSCSLICCQITMLSGHFSIPFRLTLYFRSGSLLFWMPVIYFCISNHSNLFVWLFFNRCWFNLQVWEALYAYEHYDFWQGISASVVKSSQTFGVLQVEVTIREHQRARSSRQLDEIGDVSFNSCSFLPILRDTADTPQVFAQHIWMLQVCSHEQNLQLWTSAFKWMTLLVCWLMQ
jgi:hypothetical protein